MGMIRGYTDTAVQAQDVMSRINTLLTGEGWTNLGTTTLGSFDFTCWQLPTGTPNGIVVFRVGSTGTGDISVVVCEGVDLTGQTVTAPAAEASYASDMMWWPKNGGAWQQQLYGTLHTYGTPLVLPMDSTYIQWQVLGTDDPTLVEYVVAAGPRAIALAGYERDSGLRTHVWAGRAESLWNTIPDPLVVVPINGYGFSTRAPIHPDIEPWLGTTDGASPRFPFRYYSGVTVGHTTGQVASATRSYRFSAVTFGPSGAPCLLSYYSGGMGIYDPADGTYLGLHGSSGTVNSVRSVTTGRQDHVYVFGTDAAVNIGDSMTADGRTYYYTGFSSFWLCDAP